MDIVLLVSLVLLNGVFAMSEIALVTARRARLAKLAADGHGAAAVALRLGEDPTQFLSTVQVGITSVGILSGIIGQAVLAGPLALWLEGLGVDADVAAVGATALVVTVITYVTIVVGELVPKRLGQLRAEGIATLVARPMQWLAQAARPFVWLLSASTNALLRVLRLDRERPASVTEEEIHAMLAEGSEAGVIEAQEHDIVRNVLRLDERQIASLMVPRGDIVYLDLAQPLEENLRRIAQSEHARFPVCEGGLGQLLGVLPARALLSRTLDGQAPDLRAGLQPPVFVPENWSAMQLLEHFRDARGDLVFAINDYGEVEGLVTLQDLLEALTGEFRPRDADEAWAIERDDGSWLLDGLIPIPELKDRLDIARAPEEERGSYHTLAGMLMLLFGRIPASGEQIDWDGWRFEVVDRDGKRIDKVLATRLLAAAAAGADEAESGDGDG